jgi:hypothetical protein
VAALASKQAAFNVASRSTTASAIATDALGIAAPLVSTPIRRAGTEGVVAAGIVEVAAHNVAGITQEDYTLLDSFLNLTASVALSMGIQGITGAYGKMRDRRIAEAEQYLSTFLGEALTSGRDPMKVAAIVQKAVNADHVPPFTTLTPEQIGSPEVKAVKDGFEARLSGEEGLMSGAVGRGSTQESAIADLQALYAKDNQHLNAVGRSPEYMQVARRIQELEEKIADFGSPRSELYRSAAKDRGVPIDELNSLKEELHKLKDEIRSGERDRDTRGNGVFYHGTSKKISSIAENTADVGSELNFYGAGFYTTDAIDVARGYTKKGARGSVSDPIIYKVVEKENVKFSF